MEATTPDGVCGLVHFSVFGRIMYVQKLRRNPVREVESVPPSSQGSAKARNIGLEVATPSQ